MKKIVVTITLSLVLCLSFAFTAYANDGSSFENAIPLPLQVRDVDLPDEGLTYFDFEFTHWEQYVYFTFTTEDAGEYSIIIYTSRFDSEILDADFNVVGERRRVSGRIIELEGNSTYFIRATPIARNAQDFEREFTDTDRADTIRILVRNRTLEEGPIFSLGVGLIVFFGTFIVFIFLVAVPYRRYTIRKYDFNPMGKPLLISVGLIALNTVIGSPVFNLLGWIDDYGTPWNMRFWVFALLMAPGFIVMTIKLIKATKNIAIIIINTVLMFGFYIVMGFIGLMLGAIIMGIIAVVLMGTALVMRGRKKKTDWYDQDGNYKGTTED